MGGLVEACRDGGDGGKGIYTGSGEDEGEHRSRRE